MKDGDRTKEQLVNELAELRQRVAELEVLESEQKRVEEALRESEEKYRNLVENSIEGIGVSKGNRIVLANRAILDIFGYETLEEFVRIPLLEHVAPESRSIIQERLKKREKGEPLSPRYEYKVIRKDGETRDLEISTSEILIGNSLPYRTFVLYSSVH